MTAISRDTFAARRSTTHARYAAIGLTLLVAIATSALVLRWREGPGATTPAVSVTKVARPSGAGGMAGMPVVTTTDGGVRLSSRQLEQFGVTFGTVERRTLSTEVIGRGTGAERSVASTFPVGPTRAAACRV